MIQKGSTVKMHYTLTVEGTVVDSSSGRDPLTYQQGGGQIISGLEKELEGLNAGDKKQVVVTPEEGYGQRQTDAIQKISKDAFEGTPDLKVGDKVQGQKGNVPIRAVVTEVHDQEVTLDFNHPLAGKTLNFDVEIVEVSSPS